MSILLWPEQLKTDSEEKSTLIPYVVKNSDRHSAIIICPGGGYHHRAHHEGEPVAHWLNSIGISAFVLNYRVSPNRYPSSLADCQRAIRYVRYHANNWNLNKEKIGILGFSAGGHLAASASSLQSVTSYEPIDGMDFESCKPNLSILCYPVISFLQHFHQGSVHNLLGEEPSQELRSLLSHEMNVTENTPPTFLWHTADDASVPVQNSLMYAQSLSNLQIPFEMHIFPNGRHGLGLAKEDPIVGKWTDLCGDWLMKQGF
jgi:acetyl esterase/lipase